MGGSGATCAELEQIINIDKAALDVERKLCKGIKDPVVLEKVQATEMKLEGQIARLEKLLEQKKLKESPSGVGCLDDKNKLAKSTGYPIPDLVGGITAAPRKGLYQYPLAEGTAVGQASNRRRSFRGERSGL